ncbi:uncharacterized protein LOC136036181 isoform X4 [Artemia franciscana]
MSVDVSPVIVEYHRRGTSSASSITNLGCLNEEIAMAPGKPNSPEPDYERVDDILALNKKKMGWWKSSLENIFSAAAKNGRENRMVSRRKILSRSRDDLRLDVPEEEEDVWQQKDKLLRDHMSEVNEKWSQIDDEIWAKVIVMERNRRVAKAYARAPVLTVNGSDDGFDGYRIGLNGFDNPMRDPKTEEIKRHIGQGVKLKMDDAGNILVKRLAKSNVYIKALSEENSISNEGLKLPNGALEVDKPVKLFDMKKFQLNITKEIQRAYPDRRQLEKQCITSLGFVRNETDPLDCPIWVMLINIVAIDMLKSKMPPMKRMESRSRNRVAMPEEDPYSVAGGSAGSSGSSGSGAPPRRSDKPPKLPPRDGHYGQKIPKPDYDDAIDEETFKAMQAQRAKDQIFEKDKKYDDPYYCGLRARISNFARRRSTEKDREREAVEGRRALLQSALGSNAIYVHPPTLWPSRSYDSGMDSNGSRTVTSYRGASAALRTMSHPFS